MKISLDEKSMGKLKGAEDYRKWKKDVVMAVTSIGAAYLLKRFGEHPLTSASASTNISTNTSTTQLLETNVCSVIMLYIRFKLD